MQSIALPKTISVEKGTEPNQGIIKIEPCYPGYGTTLGNAIRRVILSSLPGAAVIGVKIKGADHEFMGLPHIQEDVLEILLNLKKLKVKLHSEEPVFLKLGVHGEKKVKASDIEQNSQVEIANQDMVIAHITDMAGNLSMEIEVANGRGYETVESREEKRKEIGYIGIDSLYSPVLQVGLNVEDVRVGKTTNYERLILNITTDGTISPEEAMKDSINILLEQFGNVISRDVEEVKEEAKKKIEEEEEAKNKIEEEAEEVKEEVKKTEEKETVKLDQEEKDGEPKKRGRPKKS